MAGIAPENVRGAMFGMSIVLINTAAIVESGVNWAMSTEMSVMSCRLPLGLGILFPLFLSPLILFPLILFPLILFPLLLFVGLYFVDDSPTWYLTK
ncbi:hypothetical protein H9Q70_014689, partial [Fusarium xylarioides]